MHPNSYRRRSPPVAAILSNDDAVELIHMSNHHHDNNKNNKNNNSSDSKNYYRFQRRKDETLDPVGRDHDRQLAPKRSSRFVLFDSSSLFQGNNNKLIRNSNNTNNSNKNNNKNINNIIKRRRCTLSRVPSFPRLRRTWTGFSSNSTAGSCSWSDHDEDEEENSCRRQVPAGQQVRHGNTDKNANKTKKKTKKHNIKKDDDDDDDDDDGRKTTAVVAVAWTDLWLSSTVDCFCSTTTPPNDHAILSEEQAVDMESCGMEIDEAFHRAMANLMICSGTIRPNASLTTNQKKNHVPEPFSTQTSTSLRR
ncbi:hypothetical protein ACA910_009495 [Epithemia clementina (nom. ined.)]